MADKITPRETNYSQWYVDIVTKAKLADYSPVKGCMVIRPNGYALWEKMQSILDRMFKETGHKNAYFPLLIPESFIKKEAEHVEGFSPELAVVTHGGGDELDEPLIIRPTSETIIWSMYKKWIQSYRDLPLLINQWANVVRWEKRTRLFLRTTEFLWQEGHTAHATEQEAEEETLKMLFVYQKFVEEYMGISVVVGEKSESEKFAGAVKTYTIEALMQDKKALQAGTSHFLGQNFAKAFDVSFQNKKGDLEYVWATSWGVSTRLIGALIMSHSDDKGLVLPPKITPVEVVIVPIYKNDTKSRVMNYAEKLYTSLKNKFAVIFDNDDQNKPGWKFSEWEMQGVPVRIEIGPRDIDKDEAVIARRDTFKKITVKTNRVEEEIRKLLEDIQNNLFRRSARFRQENTYQISNYKDFKETISKNGGFIQAGWCGSAECEEKIKEDTKATIRAIPLARDETAKRKCIYCGKEAKVTAVFAKSY